MSRGEYIVYIFPLNSVGGTELRSLFIYEFVSCFFIAYDLQVYGMMDFKRRWIAGTAPAVMVPSWNPTKEKGNLFFLALKRGGKLTG